MAMEEPREDISYNTTPAVTRDGRTRYTTILLGAQTTALLSSVPQTPGAPEQTTATNEVPMPTTGGGDTAVTALIVFGVVLAVALILALLWWCSLPRRRRPPSRATSTSGGGAPRRVRIIVDDYPPYRSYPTRPPASPNPPVSPPGSMGHEGSDRIGRIYDPH
ncbi:hypothetical protein J3458_012965 [Metarhizium acridum]|uniref:uncharacterized protein n=1 Tax=Metarhizium acridum TaxID=92637 RepID=UPI001C6D202D|nr:hypothetical protein J3458_012965 [Metarhizium acridum]